MLEVVETVEETVKDIGYHIAESADKTKNEVTEILEQTKEKGLESMEEMAETVERMAETVKEIVRDVVETGDNKGGSC